MRLTRGHVERRTPFWIEQAGSDRLVQCDPVRVVGTIR